MSRDYEHVDFRPWYVPDTAGWLSLSLGARGLVAELLRKFDKRGQLRVRRLEDLCILLRLSWQEIEPAITELMKAERLLWDPTSGVLTDPDFLLRMRQGSAARMNRKRARDAEANDVTGVTQSDACDDVTSPLIYSDLISSDLSEKIPEEIPSARAKVPDPTPKTTPAVTADPDNPEPEWWAGVLETVGTGTGVHLPAREAWLRYAGHRASKARPAERRDAVHWLTTVMVKEARETREKDRERRDREARYDKQRAGPPNPSDTQKLSEREQADLAERFPMGRRKGAA